MTRFSATSDSEGIVPAPRSAIWAVLTDPAMLPKLTPLLRDIEAHGTTWRWEMMRIAALGVSIEPCFTEHMRFTPETRIEYSHQAPPGRRERTGAEGWYELSDVEGGTRLAISLTLSVDLPLPRISAPAVTGVMSAAMARTGARFSTNLHRQLGVKPIHAH